MPENYRLGNSCGLNSIQARKRHIKINFRLRLALGRPRVCPKDKPRLSPYFTQWKPSSVRDKPSSDPWDRPGGRRAAGNVVVVKVNVSFSLTNY